MTKINSVLGPIDSGKLGYTLMHEHILSAPIGVYPHYPELLGPDFPGKIFKGMVEARAGGVNTVVDASTFDLGRDITLLVESSKKSKINIICCTGWWLSDHHNLFGPWSVDRFAELFVKEVKEGIGKTGVKAGILKSAADRGGVTRKGEAMLRAVAMAQLQTGVPVMLHSCSPEKVGTQQVAILKEEGVDPKRIKVDHSLDTTDTGYLCSLLEQGCYLGVDRLPGLFVKPEEQAKVIKKLIDEGWAHRLLFSHDAGMVLYAPEMPPEIQKFVEHNSPFNKFLYIKKGFFPMLAELGVSAATLDRLCIDNPRNFFEGI